SAGTGGHEPAPGMAETNLFGAVTAEKILDWIRDLGPDATLTPVIDTNQTWAVDQHDPPEAMREQVLTRDRNCVFPHCSVDSRRCDLDHITAYDDTGPPGQTSPDRLAPLCRRHHLAKTHGRWSYVRNKDGTYTWTNQYRRTWLVTTHGTIELPTN
ncbi:HNH endonuclease signature motif containing protein, partial [Nocardioides sp. Soil796]|uniref:HNH endonuclease signature motif containing protein n=1 Tax=Nocardioides sp. Soil796 TaxID=1736412 RepID=UPI00138F588C